MTTANKVDAGKPTNEPGMSELTPVENWLGRAMADFAVQGVDDEAPVDLSQSLAAMAALLQEAFRRKEGPRVAAPDNVTNGRKTEVANNKDVEFHDGGEAGEKAAPASARSENGAAILTRLEAGGGASREDSPNRIFGAWIWAPDGAG